MKKIISIVLIFFFIAGVFLMGGCNNKSDELVTIKLNEVTHSIFYAPQYAAIALGYFEDEGLKIELTNGGGADKTMAAVLSGDADIGLCGPEATVYVYNQGQEDYAVNFAQLTKCDGSFLMGRVDDKDFTIEKLRGSYIIGGRPGGMPEMSLEYVLKKNGIIPGVDVTIDTSIAFNAMAGAFIGGTGDYVALFEPNATALEKASKGYVLMSVGEMSGEIPYTVYNAKLSTIKDNSKTIKKFTKAIQKGLDYVKKSSAEEIAATIAPFFPDTANEDLVKVVQRYKDIGAYSETTLLTEDAFNLMQDIVKEAGLLEQRAPYDKLVNTSFSK